jgi:hypothetical protein
MFENLLVFCFGCLLISNGLLLMSVDSKKNQIKQERNDAIVFCVENPTDCKAEYLKLK